MPSEHIRKLTQGRGDVIAVTDALLQELEASNRIEAMAPARVIAVTSLVLGLVVLLLTAHAFWAKAHGSDAVNHPAMTLATGLFLLGVAAYFRNKQDYSRPMAYRLTALTCLVYLTAVISNGAVGFFTLPGFIVLLHVFAPPNTALFSSLLSVVVGCVVVTYPSQTVETVILLRILMDCVIAVVMLQVTSRQRVRLNNVAQWVAKQLTTMVKGLKSDLDMANLATEMAAKIDKQTGLLNVTAFEEALDHEIYQRATGRAAAIVSVRFEHVDDFLATFDDEDKELFLISLVNILTGILQPTPLARRGKWEFAGILNLDSSDQGFSEQVASRLARLQQPMILNNRSLPLYARIGLAVWPHNASNARRLCQCADIAQKAASDMRRVDPVFFAPEMEAMVLDRVSITESIDRAMQNDEFVLYYQPIITSEGGPIRKAEALIRWNDPKRGMVSPSEFIPLAESYGKVNDLTKWVVSKAVQQVKSWRTQTRPDFQVSVNVPPSFLEWFAENRPEGLAWLMALKCPRNGLVIEITEGAFLNVTPAILTVVRIFRAWGVEVALDDFGVGYSSFGQIDRLPLDYIKLDKALVDHIESSSSKLAICRTIISLAHELSLRVVAEGVETMSQAVLLSEARCNYLQGYVYSKPLPVAEFEKYVAEWTDTASDLEFEDE
jgi:EAL domain-containing protein (putative c-di-GMP-specific phosphodiesterase class I)/GGDEF domain-containing protein